MPINRPKDPLLLAGKVLTFFMQGAMAIAAVALAIAIPAVLLFSTDFAISAGMEDASFPEGFPIPALVGVMAIGIAIVAALFVFFGKLRNIIGTVGEGDPFVPANADRLNAMAWLLLATQVLLLPAAGLGMLLVEWADEAEGAEFSVDGGLDLSGILMVVVLFILARVFRQGAAMREDLEGTV
ncbi:DUF2975 domain-containing protein [Parerythrobacter lacustris]|uniref:DUF2975 domain-containing protein n=1 Tax=Parerythrobacter lacustris TaxID=2969984 RepID=A0ABT1XSH4_9SPHN|nr:DUF2975 domain-containing protein [Parerythrobacter lacustris]MCR2834172.1 DUF2975 domain-containing protein [Parerythrobacter lacustris]